MGNNQFLIFTAEIVAQFKNTVLLLPNGTILATTIPFDASLYESEHKVEDEELLKLLSEEVKLVAGSASVGGAAAGESKSKKKRSRKPKTANSGAEGDKENSSAPAKDAENKA